MYVEGDKLICVNKPEWAEFTVNKVYEVVKASKPSIWLKADNGQRLSFIEWKNNDIYIYKYFRKVKSDNMIKLYNGDCLEVMDNLIEQGVKVDAIITDPPLIDLSRFLWYTCINTRKVGYNG